MNSCASVQKVVCLENKNALVGVVEGWLPTSRRWEFSNSPKHTPIQFNTQGGSR